MVQKSNKLLIILCLLVNLFSFAQENGVTLEKNTDYKNDSTYKNFNTLRVDVAKAQINLLKNGALLVRLKTNSGTVSKLKAAGNMDLATQVERETYLTNKAIVRGFVNEFKFCPVYFFNSDYSDSVKHKKLDGILLDTNLHIDSTIQCKASFYLVAEQGTVYESSLGFVPENQAHKASEKGAASKEAAIVVKNRYFIQVHKPFPVYEKGYNIKQYRNFVKKFNLQLQTFYTKNTPYAIPQEVMRFVY